MYVYTTTNPCLCTPQSIPDPDCPEDCNCLKLCSITLNESDPSAVGPCAQTGTMDVADPSRGHELCACGLDTGKWTVADYDSEIFINASVTSVGVLSWTTQGPESLDKQYGAITLKFCCGRLSAYMCVIIGVQDLCCCPGCDVSETCDVCTGICSAIVVDTEVNSALSSVDTLITS